MRARKGFLFASNPNHAAVLQADWGALVGNVTDTIVNVGYEYILYAGEVKPLEATWRAG